MVGGEREGAVRAVMLLLGVQSLASGINWWYKILPFPNIHEKIEGPIKHEILQVMIESNWMFSSAKVIEILLGIALILNRHAVLALVLSFPIMLMTFLLDLWPFVGKIGPYLDGLVPWPVFQASLLDMLFFGGGVFAMQAYLMSALFDEYRGLFVAQPGAMAPGWAELFEAGWLKAVLRWLSFTVGAASTVWMLGMATKLIPWSSLAILAPPR